MKKIFFSFIVLAILILILGFYPKTAICVCTLPYCIDISDIREMIKKSEEYQDNKFAPVFISQGDRLNYLFGDGYKIEFILDSIEKNKFININGDTLDDEIINIYEKLIILQQKHGNVVVKEEISRNLPPLVFFFVFIFLVLFFFPTRGH